MSPNIHSDGLNGKVKGLLKGGEVAGTVGLVDGFEKGLAHKATA